MRTKAQRRAFTLIELLAVIAILLILVSLLLPGLRRLMDKARFLICMSNVRQITNANVLYTGDHDGMLVGPNWVPSRWGGDVLEKGWLHGTNRTQLFGAECVRSGLLFAYLKEERVFRCPADPQAGATNLACNYPQDTRIMTSYIMNGSVCSYGDGSRDAGRYDTSTHLWKTFRISQFKQSDFIFWEGDEKTTSFGDWWDGANSPNQFYSTRHMGDNMLGCVDGHGERVTGDEYRMIEATPGRNRLWNNPEVANGRW